MVAFSEIPGVMPLAEYVWGGEEASDDAFSAELCLSGLPLMNGACWTRLIVKGLGVGIILGACLNKAPVMYNIWSSKSGEGLSKAAMFGDVLMYSNGAFYGFLEKHPFTAYGENASLLFQSIIIILMLWYLVPTSKTQEKIQASVVYIVYIISVTMLLPEEHHSVLMASMWPVLIYSRGSQILETYRVKHTGAQSIITLTMNLAGASVRIITTIHEVGWDMAVLTGFLISVLLNFIMFSQYFYYKANTEKFVQELGEKKKQA